MVTERNICPQCEFCCVTMLLRRVFPKTWTLPEVRAYECNECGNARSVENEIDVVAAT